MTVALLVVVARCCAVVVSEQLASPEVAPAGAVFQWHRTGVAWSQP